jgi:uncharacterized protein
MDLVKRDWHLFNIKGEYFLFHSLGSLYQLDRESYEVIDDILNGREPGEWSIDILEELNEVLRAIPDFYPQDTGELVVKSICLNVSHICNMSCDYCFASHNFSSTNSSLMSSEIAYKAIDFLIESSKDVRNIEIDFFGGEPLLNLETVKRSAIYAREKAIKHNKNLRINLTTNGLLLDEETLNILDDLDISIVLSLDGGKKVHDRLRHTISGRGTFDYILPNAQRLAQRRADGGYYIRGTYTQETLNFSESFKELASLGFKYISLEPVVTKDPALSIKDEHLPILRKEYESIAEECMKSDTKFFHFELPLNEGACLPRLARGCGAGVEYLAVTPNGDIYPCHQFVGYDSFKLGNLKELTLDASLKKEFRSVNTISKKPVCEDCWARYLCGGGCHANNYIINRDIYSPYRIGCEVQKLRIEYALWLKAKKSEVYV